MPAAPSKFTLSVHSPNNTGNIGPSDTGINGLGVTTFKTDDTFTEMTTVVSSSQKPTEFFIDSKGLLTDIKRNGTWRHAYVGSFFLEDSDRVRSLIGFDTVPDSAGWSGAGDYPIWLKWEITSDDFLIPAGNYSSLPWYFCASDPPIDTDDDKWDHSYGGGLGIGALEPTCSHIKGLKVHKI